MISEQKLRDYLDRLTALAARGQALSDAGVPPTMAVVMMEAFVKPAMDLDGILRLVVEGQEELLTGVVDDLERKLSDIAKARHGGGRIVCTCKACQAKGVRA